MKESRLTSTDLSLIFIIFVWGLNYSVIKSALKHFAPLSFNGLRFALASFIILLVLTRSERNWPALKKDWRLILTVGLLGDFVYQYIFINGMHLTLAGNTSLILASTPVFVALLAHLLGYDKVDRRMWIGIFVSFSGIALIVLGGRETLDFTSRTFRGDLLEFIAAVVWSAYVVLSTPLIDRHGAVTTAAATMWAGAVFLFLSAVPSLAHQNWRVITWMDWGGLVFSATFPIALGQIVWYRGISKIGNARTSAYSNFTPLVGLFAAWPLLGETPRAVQLFGAAAILGGVLLIRVRRVSPSAE